MSDPYDSIAARAEADPYGSIARPARPRRSRSTGSEFVGAQWDNNPTPPAERLLRFVREAPRRAGAPDGRTSPERARERYGQNPTVRNPVTGRTEATRGIPTQMVSNLGLGDELMGGGAYLRQGAENLVRRATGQPIEITGADAYHAGAQQDRDEARRYATEHPIRNAAAMGLGFLTAGAPNAAAAGAATGGSAVVQTLRAGRNAAAASAPYAFAAAEGNPVERLPQTAANMAMAGGLGMGLNRAAAFFGNRATQVAANPPPPTDRQVMLRNGIDMTPGMATGGIGRTVEDSLGRLPLVGDAIKMGQRSSIRSYNRAEINAGLAQIGQRLPRGLNVGREGIAYADGAVSDAYRAALDGVTDIRPDPSLAGRAQAVVDGIRHGERRADAAGIVDDIVLRFRGPLTGQEWKQLDSDLVAEIAAARTSTAPGARQLRQALTAIRQLIRDPLQASHPQVLAQVRAADQAFARLQRIGRASEQAGTAAREGVVTPAQMDAAVRNGARGTRQYRQGNALGQNLSDPAMRVLPQTLPDSGTPGGMVTNWMLGAGGAAAAGSGNAALSVPAMLYGAGAVTAGAVYNPATQAALNVIYRAIDRAGQTVQPGQVEAALGVLAREASRNPALVPIYEQALGQARPAGGPRPTTPSQAEPTYQ